MSPAVLTTCACLFRAGSDPSLWLVYLEGANSQPRARRANSQPRAGWALVLKLPLRQAAIGAGTRRRARSGIRRSSST